MKKTTASKTDSQKENSERTEINLKTVKQKKEKSAVKKNGKKKNGKSELKKDSKPKPQLNKKIQKILSDMFSNKSAKFIKLHQLGLKPSEIARLTNSHPSFVSGVIARLKADLNSLH